MEPVVISVLFHPKFQFGKLIARSIHDYYYRPSDDLVLHSTIGIPVYYASSFSPPIAIEFGAEKSDLHFLIMLIDEEMLADELWVTRIRDLISTKDDHDYIVIPVLFSEYGFGVVGNLQSINLYLLPGDPAEKLVDLYIALSDLITRSLCRLLNEAKTKPRTLQVFISHAKIDGRIIAESIRSYLDLQSPMSSFFDTYDIEVGEDFKKQLVEKVQGSFFLSVVTDRYSTRPWCLKEIITAKKNKIPMLAVDAISVHGDRIFPYIGNAPIVRWYDNESTLKLITEKILYEYLRHIYQYCFLDGVANELPVNKTVFALPKAPELLDLPRQDNCTLLYPEPPLGIDELSILEEFNPSITFASSSQFIGSFSKDDACKIKRIGLSISNYIEIEKNGIGEEHFYETFCDIIKHLVISDFKIAYGGDWRKGGFTETLATIMRTFKSTQNTSEFSKETCFDNYLAWPIYLTVRACDKAENLDVVHYINVPEPYGFDIDGSKWIDREGEKNRLIWAHSLSKMRQQMAEEIDARVILGGKPSNAKGGCPGILEEAYLSILSNQPVFLIGGYGGCAFEIVQMLLGKKHLLEFADSLTDKEFVKQYNYYADRNGTLPINVEEIASAFEGRGFSCLGNGLSDEENLELATSRSSYRIVSLILKGLSQLT